MPEKTPKINGTRIVAIGGGTGLATLLSGLKAYVGKNGDGLPEIDSLSAIVAVTDDGGSSGRLRDEMQMPPPGDIRNCMVALSEDEMLLSQLFQHRFSGEGPLSGHNFGNLFLAALSEMTGDFAEAVRLSSEILSSKGRIYPASVSDVRIAAKLKNGTTVHGETSVAKIGPQIDRLYLEPKDCKPHPEAISAIQAADLITVGPGSLYTSLLPPLLVSGIEKAVSESKATKIFICNLMTQPGETDGLSARRHLEIVRDYLHDLFFDFIVVNSRSITDEQTAKYHLEGAVQIGVHGSVEGTSIGETAILHQDILAAGELVRHDPAKLAKLVIEAVRG